MIDLENPETVLGMVDAAGNYVAQIRLALMVGDKSHAMHAVEQAERLLFNAMSKIEETESGKEDVPNEITECPQCSESVIQPRTGGCYCEECGWPDEHRTPDEHLIERHDGVIIFVHSPECAGFCDYACNRKGSKQAELLTKHLQNDQAEEHSA